MKVSGLHKEEGENLGAWMAYQRTSYRNGTLQAYKCDKLEALGVVWENTSVGKHQEQWESMLARLVEYRDRVGDCFVPQNYKTEDDKALGLWLHRQRKNIDKGELPLSRQECLEEVGVVWGEVAPQKWENMYHRLSEFQRKEGHCFVPCTYKDEDGKNLGTWLNTQRESKKKGLLDRELQNRLEAIGVAWEVYSNQWEEMFSRLEDYQLEIGDCNVPRDYKVLTTKGNEKQLGRWVCRQRQYKKGGTLDAHRLAKLEGIGMIWDLDDHKWEDMFSRLAEYKENEGHCDIPRKYTANGDSKPLGIWLSTQRSFKRNGVLDPIRTNRLEELGVEWDPQSRDWNEMFHLLTEYQQREGNCLVPRNYKEDGKNLWMWLRLQRSEQKKGRLSVDRCEALEDLGVICDTNTAKWDHLHSLLVQYQERHGHCRVPVTHKEDGANLGTWLQTQRKNWRAGTLDPSKHERLEKAGVVWSLSAHKWDEVFALLVAYKEHEGDCMVPQKHKEDGTNLGAWLYQQRQHEKSGILQASRKQQLEAIGVVWDLSAYKRENMLSSLARYRERKGNCNVPHSYKEDDKTLGTWLNRQRQLKAAGKLDSELSDRLEDLGVVWSVNEQKWETMFELMLRYQAREGHCRVPQDHIEGRDGKNLGLWLDRQRQRKRKGKLDGALQDRLETIGVKWKIYAKFDDDDDWGFEGMDHLFEDDGMWG